MKVFIKYEVFDYLPQEFRNNKKVTTTIATITRTKGKTASEHIRKLREAETNEQTSTHIEEQTSKHTERVQTGPAGRGAAESNL